MKEEHLVDNIDSLVFQFAVKTREASQKKNGIQKQIKECRALITEKRSYTEAIQGYIKNLEEEIRVKQSTVTKNKEKAKSMKVTNSLLLQYEQTLKTELESRKSNYDHDQKVYEERLASYLQTLQSYKERYFQNPIAQKLLQLQAEIEKIESRIKHCDDCMMMKKKELEYFTDPDVTSYSMEKLPDGVLGEHHTTEEQSEQTKEDCSIDMSYIDLNQAASDHEPAAEVNTEEMSEENELPDPTSCFTTSDKSNEELWSLQLSDESGPPEEMHSEAEEPEISQEEQVQVPTLPEEVQKDNSQDEASDAEDYQEANRFPQTSQEANLQALSSAETSVFSTPTFAFNFSPTSSPRQGTPDSKSSAFVLNLNSNVSTPGFPGFGFDVGPSQEEESSFAFSGSFFNDKKATDAKSSSTTEFLFDQPEQSEDFQFAFTSKSPQSSKKNSKDEFPFSFNF
ncbi:protein SIX6OS1 isoform X2 [Gambusia affinis]|uniref:protein SIX6OS1 isoform X2 n=1 Tax=Gambusia affinis TaxID=33528 RepID=UPI001CDC0E62|nr:protein SIX6OS1 isoform X2 [Gambusia affinis]